jgi:oligopeptide/dipeptide ABC transporter ATP-binding protein
VLAVRNLTIATGPESDPRPIVSGVSFVIGRGEVLGLVGESGCGKSMTSLAIMGLLPEPGPRVRAGSVELDGVDVTTTPPWQRVEAGRGHIAMIFQEPMTSLNPVVRIGNQIAEAVHVHDGLTGGALRERTRELLEMVRFPDAALQMGAYPHQLSGGMRQRVMIAIALACQPHVLIADEPTTALDVTVQFQILGLLRELCDKLDMAMLFITHDFGVVAQLVDRVAVMYAGRIVETATVDALFRSPAHPYTRGLMACMPAAAGGAQRLRTIPGQAPRPGAIPFGCAFAPRCPDLHETCRVDPLPRIPLGEGHEALCKFPVTDGRRL